MSVKSFFTWLLLVSAGTAATLALLHFVAAPARPHLYFSVIAIALFALVCIGLFFAGKSAAQSKNKYAFTNLVSVSVFGKMILAMAALFLYQQSAKPENQWFVGIFLWCYVVYTAFEVWFMTKLAKS